MSNEIVIITEDAYGGEFFKRVLVILNRRGLLKDVRLKKLSGRRKNPIHAPYLCNPKLNRIIKAVEISKPDLILITYDGDGPSSYASRLIDVKKHIPKETKTPVRILLFEYEIEEWICKSLELSWSIKPSDELKRRFDYKKSQLPMYADKLDFGKLKGNCRSFRRFLEILGG